MDEKLMDMAREAGAVVHGEDPRIDFDTPESLARFADLVRADEREACAKVCDELERGKWESVGGNGGRISFAGPLHCASAIRTRGKQE